MRRYETIIIMDPDLSAEQREPVLQRVADVVSQGDGYFALTDEWGARKLAYEIRKKERGHYIRFDFCGTGAVVDEMERFFRIDDRVMKYMTVLLDRNADIEKIKEEIAEAQSKAALARAQAEAAEAQPAEEPVEEAQSPEQPPEEARSSEQPADTEKAQTEQPEPGVSQTAPSENQEEKK